MIDAFDGQAVPLPGLWPGVAVLVALTACVVWRWSGRKLLWIVPAAIVVVGVFGIAVPAWDHIRLKGMLASGEGVSVTRGTITQTWHIEDRRRDYNSSMRNAYKTVVSEGFDVGADRFSWVIGQCLSAAGLCNLSVLKTPLAEGQQVEVTWFADPAQQGERRVLRLRIVAQPRPR